VQPPLSDEETRSGSIACSMPRRHPTSGIMLRVTRYAIAGAKTAPRFAKPLNGAARCVDYQLKTTSPLASGFFHPCHICTSVALRSA
jgi:hypothetical protein